MSPDQRFAVGALFLGALLVIAAALMWSVPLGLLVAGGLCVFVGAVVLRGSRS